MKTAKLIKSNSNLPDCSLPSLVTSQPVLHIIITFVNTGSKFHQDQVTTMSQMATMDANWQGCSLAMTLNDSRSQVLHPPNPGVWTVEINQGQLTLVMNPRHLTLRYLWVVVMPKHWWIHSSCTHLPISSHGSQPYPNTKHMHYDISMFWLHKWSAKLNKNVHLH